MFFAQNNRQHYKQAPCRPMLSEWLIEKPEDFDEMWLGVICPVGKRCIVMASHVRHLQFGMKLLNTIINLSK